VRFNIIEPYSINYLMKLLQQILSEAGAELDRSFTVVPGFGGYFKSVKRVDDYSPERVVLTVAKMRLTVTGKKLIIDKYFQQDLLLRGEITGVGLE